jgi:DNA end-binding protein Ku
MPARAIASASISFGLVNVPVKLFPATQQAAAGISFHLLHKECGSRLKQQYICPRDEAIVPRNDMVKGYEFAKDQYVVFTPDELKSLEEKADQTIDIKEFVPLDKIDPVYFDKPYYLTPDRGGDKAYHLLAQVMRDTGRTAIATYAARGKQYLVIIRPGEDGLVMQQLLYADEVRPFSEVEVTAPPQLRDAELKLASQLVEQISSDSFNPGQYEDEVKKRIMADVQKKVEGKEIESPEPVEAPAQIIDLMEALKASLGGARKGGNGGSKKTAGSAPESAAERRPARASRDEKPKRSDKGSEKKSARNK